MNNWLVGSVVGLGMLLSSETIVQAQGKGAARKHQWHTSYETARQEARRTGKPLMVVFRCEP